MVTLCTSTVRNMPKVMLHHHPPYTIQALLQYRAENQEKEANTTLSSQREQMVWLHELDLCTLCWHNKYFEHNSDSRA